MAQRGPVWRLGVGPTSTAFSSWKLGLPGRTLPRRMELSHFFTIRLHRLLQAEPGHQGGPRLGAVLLPVPLQEDFPTPQVWAGTAWGAAAALGVGRWGLGVAQLSLGPSYEKSPLRHTRVCRYRKPNSELGTVNSAGTAPGLWCPRETPPRWEALCYL